MDKTRRTIFQIAAIFFIAALAFIVIFMANPPETSREANAAPKRMFTRGEFITGPLSVDAGKTLDFKIDLNRRAMLKGRFAVLGPDRTIAFEVVDEPNYKKLKAGEEHETVIATGQKPGGQVGRLLQPGVYFAVFDNRQGRETTEIPEAAFTVD
jgi:hypothetical protein